MMSPEMNVNHELIPVRKFHFNLKGCEGDNVQFKLDEDAKVSELIFHYSTGSLHLKIR